MERSNRQSFRTFATPDSCSSPKPPKPEVDKGDSGRLLHRDVKYPETHEAIMVPDQWCQLLLKSYDRILSRLVRLKMRLVVMVSAISPIVQDSIEGTDFHRTHGLSAAVTRTMRELVPVR